MIRTKDQLLEWLEDHITNPIHLWSIENDAVEVLGFFEHHTKEVHYAGFTVKLISKHGSTYCLNIGDIDRGRGRKYIACLIYKPQWRFWNPKNSINPLFAGDNPVLYKELRDGSEKIYQSKKSTGVNTPPNRS